MKWLLTLCLFALTFHSAAQAEDPPPTAQTREDQPPAKEKPLPAATTAPTKKLPPKLIAFAEIEFADPQLSQRIKQLEKRIGEMTDATWERGPWCYPEGYSDFRTWWSSNPGTHDPLGNATAGRPLGEAGHNLSLHAQGDLRKQESLVQSIRLNCSWHPPQSGWGAQLWYCEGAKSNSPGEEFGFQVIRWTAGESWEYADRLVSTQELSFYSGMKRYDSTEYYVHVRLPAERMAEDRPLLPRISIWLKSPESFRDEALARLDRLHELIASEFLANRGIDARVAPLDGQPKSKYQLKRSNRRLSQIERERLIAIAQAEIARRTELIEQNYVEMHAALTRTFPLLQFLEMR